MRAVALGEVCQVTTGQSAPQEASAFSSSGIPFVRAGSLERLCDGESEDSLELVPTEQAAKYRLKIFPRDTVVFAKSGMSAKVGRVHRLRRDCHIVSHLAAVLPSNEVDPGYLHRWFEHSPPSRLIENDAYPSIKTSALERIEIPLPALADQRRIAAILGKADALRTKRREAIAKLDQLLQSVFLEMFGDPATNPRNWPLAQLGSLGEWRSGGTPSRANPSYFKGDIPWYSSGELNDVYAGSSAEMISDAALRSSAAKLMVPGTLMVGMYDTAAFKSSITTVLSACNQAIAFSHLGMEKANVLYVYLALQVGKEHFKRMQRGVRQKNLNLSMVRSTEIPLPPVGEQLRFAKFFETVRAKLLDQRKSLEVSDRLFGALQMRAFNP